MLSLIQAVQPITKTHLILRTFMFGLLMQLHYLVTCNRPVSERYDVLKRARPALGISRRGSSHWWSHGLLVKYFLDATIYKLCSLSTRVVLSCRFGKQDFIPVFDNDLCQPRLRFVVLLIPLSRAQITAPQPLANLASQTMPDWSDTTSDSDDRPSAETRGLCE